MIDAAGERRLGPPGVTPNKKQDVTCLRASIGEPTKTNHNSSDQTNNNADRKKNPGVVSAHNGVAEDGERTHRERGEHPAS